METIIILYSQVMVPVQVMVQVQIQVQVMVQVQVQRKHKDLKFTKKELNQTLYKLLDQNKIDRLPLT